MCEQWLPWQDRELAKILLNVRPFVAARGQGPKAWGTVAEQLHKAGIERSAEAAILRFKALRKLASVRHTGLRLIYLNRLTGCC